MPYDPQIDFWLSAKKKVPLLRVILIPVMDTYHNAILSSKNSCQYGVIMGGSFQT